MSIINANPCQQKGPAFYTLQTVDDLAWIKTPKEGDIATLIADGVTEFWVFDFDFTGDTDGFDYIAGGCRGAWVRGGSVINPSIFGMIPGDTDEFAQINNEAIERALSLADGREVRIPSGLYRVVGNIDVPSNTVISGNGTLKFVSNTTSVAIMAIQNQTNVTIDGPTFDGNVSEKAVWGQHHHAILVEDSSYVSVRNCTFQNLIGDGIMFSRLGSPPYTGATKCMVTGCFFKGTNDNRNGISVICGSEILIDGNQFEKMSRIAMPGAIDFEPDDINDFIFNCAAINNIFIGGDVADIVDQTGISVNNSIANGTVRGIKLSNNLFSGNFLYQIYCNGGSSGEDTVEVSNNFIRNGFYSSFDVTRGISWRAFNGSIRGNTLTNLHGSGIWIESGELLVSDNYVRQVGRQCLVVGSLPSIHAVNNDLIDGGFYGTNPFRGAIYLESTGGTYRDNRIRTTNPAYSRFGIYGPAGSNNFFDGNYFTGIGSSNYNFSNTQLWGNNFSATQGAIPDTIGASNAAMYPFWGDTTSHTALLIGNGLVAFVNGQNSAYKNIQCGDAGVGNLVAGGRISGVGLSNSISDIKTGAYQILGIDFTVLADTTGGGFTIDLPDPADSVDHIFVVKKVSVDGNILTVATPFGGTIDGAATVTTTTKTAIRFQSDGTDWYLI